MPIPKPKKQENQSDYIERGMSNPTMKKEFPSTKQRLAVLYNTWRQEKENVDKHTKRKLFYRRLEEIFPEFSLDKRSQTRPVFVSGRQAALIHEMTSSPLLYVMLMRPFVQYYLS